MRIMALDWGEVRIGAAISDEEGRIAFPFEKILDNKKAVDQIVKLVDRLKIEKIVIGKPLNLAGEEAESASKVDKFFSQLKKKLKIPLEYLDERFTTIEAGKLLDQQGLSEKKQKEIKDNIAAQIILQAYLDYRAG
ncbi:MAG: Holliday junction resolvase RuvX [Candidatus Doudnabacteria bacterium]|nr:Holliday junction resolvase RuvX [Candidatus Doudnabacteria bacterium]